MVSRFQTATFAIGAIGIGGSVGAIWTVAQLQTPPSMWVANAAVVVGLLLTYALFDTHAALGADAR